LGGLDILQLTKTPFIYSVSSPAPVATELVWGGSGQKISTRAGH